MASPALAARSPAILRRLDEQQRRRRLIEGAVVCAFVVLAVVGGFFVLDRHAGDPRVISRPSPSTSVPSSEVAGLEKLRVRLDEVTNELQKRLGDTALPECPPRDGANGYTTGRLDEPLEVVLLAFERCELQKQIRALDNKDSEPAVSR